jgi:hypothetical protein
MLFEQFFHAVAVQSAKGPEPAKQQVFGVLGQCAMSTLSSLLMMTRAMPGRAARALYGGRQKIFGNNVSFSKRRYVHDMPVVDV